ncbi:MAG TPA: hypothetical protein VIH06_06530, partial [Ilumatobacteraceae bacterium]
EDAGGPRWIGPVAAAALVAIFGYGVATSASSGAPQVAPAASTAVPHPTTTIPVPTTTIAPKLVPYYAASPPREYTVSYAAVNTPTPGFQGNGTYELWATDQANANSGAWFSIETQPGGSPLFAVDAYRVQTDDGPIAISHSSSGQSILNFRTSNGTAGVTMTAGGITDERLVQLARSITVDSGEIHLNDDSVFPSFRRITGVHPLVALLGTPAEQVLYQSSRDPGKSINVSAGPRLPSSQGGGTLDRQIAIRFFLEHPTPFSVDGHVAAAGSIVGNPTFALATWIAGDHIVTVSGSTTVPELIAIARTVHAVSDNEWSGMQLQADLHTADNNNRFGGFQTQPVDVSFGTDGNGNDWVVRVSMLTYGKEQRIQWQGNDDASAYESPAADTAKINTVVNNNRTYVFADLPRLVAPTAKLHVVRDGLDPVVVPFMDVDARFDHTFAAYAFSEPTKYTAQIIAEDGSVLADWPAA